MLAKDTLAETMTQTTEAQSSIEKSSEKKCTKGEDEKRLKTKRAKKETNRIGQDKVTRSENRI